MVDFGDLMAEMAELRKEIKVTDAVQQDIDALDRTGGPAIACAAAALLPLFNSAAATTFQTDR